MDKKSTGEIQNLITDFENKYSSLHTRMDSDYDLWRLKEYKLDDFSDNITSTYPKFYANAILSQLSGAKLLITVNRLDRDKSLESKMERAFYGWLSLIDENLVKRLLPPLQASTAFMSTIRGAIAGRVIFKDYPDVFPYDSRYFSYGVDSKGIVWSGYTTYREPYAIEFEYNIKPKPNKKNVGGKEIDQPTKVIEWMDDKYYQVVVENEFVTDEEHDWKRPPVVYVPIGATPLIVSSSDKYDYVSDWCESVYGSSRNLYEIQSKIMSIWMSLLVKSHRPSYFLFTADGSMKLQGTPWGKGEILPLPLESKVEQVKPPDIAASAPQLFNIIAQLIGMGDYPSLYYGQLWKGQELSGKSISNIFENVEQVKGTLLQGMATFYKTCLRKLGEQFVSSENGMTVTGFDSKGSRFIEDVTPDVFLGDYDLTVEFRSTSPDQEASNYAKGQMAKQNALASDSFIMEKIIQYQDPKKIENELYIQKAEQLMPEVLVNRIVRALIEEGRTEEAQLIQQKLQMAMQQPQGGQPQGGPPPQGGSPPMMPQGMPPMQGGQSGII